MISAGALSCLLVLALTACLLAWLPNGHLAPCCVARQGHVDSSSLHHDCLCLQMSAAAFIKGLLDLEGSSLTPILVSLVTKNASMLDAFGKVRTAHAGWC